MAAARSLPCDQDGALLTPIPVTPSSTRTRTVLYVEDNPANLKLVEQILARHPKINLLTAIDGTRGYQLALEALPDVILLDINLLGLDGYDVLKLLRAHPATADIPVLAVSANATPLDIQTGLKAGFFRYITKPINILAFMESLEEALGFSGTSHPDDPRDLDRSPVQT
jgi:CheY-like chemotaxis protein